MSGNKRQKQKIQVNYVFQLSTGSPTATPPFPLPDPLFCHAPWSSGNGKVTQSTMGWKQQFGIEIELMLQA